MDHTDFYQEGEDPKLTKLMDDFETAGMQAFVD